MWMALTIIGVLTMLGGLGIFIATGFIDWDDPDYDFKHDLYFIGGLIICMIGGFLFAVSAMNI